MRKLYFVIFLLFISQNSLFAQFFTTETNRNISVSFHYSKIESAANKSIFNVISIKNATGRAFTGKLIYTQPAGWSIVGKSEIELNIPAKDSIAMPIRAIVSKDVVGEVGYAIIANIFDENDKPLTSEYCFITIPRISKLKIIAPRRVLYFDHKNQTAQFSYYISNKGNTSENVQLAIMGNENLSVESNRLDKTYAYEYNIPAHKDTTVNIRVKLDKPVEGKDSYKTEISVFTQDSLYKNNLWFFKVDNIYNHTIPDNNKCAIIEITASDLLSAYKPKYSLYARGNILFKNNYDFSYDFYKNNLETDWDDYYQNRFYLQLKHDYFKLGLGTIESMYNEYIYGIGGKAEYYNLSKRLTLGGFYSYNENTTQTSFGAQIAYKINKNLQAIVGYAQNDFSIYNNYTKILLSGIDLSFLKRSSISIRAYFNQTRHALNTPFNKEGLGLISNYSGNYGKLNIYARVEYGTPDYSGRSRGKLIANANLNYTLNTISYLNFSYFKNDYINSYYIDDIYQPEKKSYYDAYRLSYNRMLTKSLYLQTGPILRFEKFNVPYISYQPYFYFKTYSPRLYFALRYNTRQPKLYLKPSIDLGTTEVTNALDLDNNLNTRYFTYNINFNTIYNDFRFYLTYRNGPYSIYQQYYYYNSSYFSKWFFMMPSYSKYLFNDRFQLDLRLIYRLDANSKNNSVTFTNQAIIQLAKTWQLRFLNSISTQSRRDLINNATIRYNSMYFEASLRKEFHCNQPRFQYRNLNVVFFKDLNGNRVKEPNEPGLRNVLAAIEPDYELEDQKVKKDFVSTKLLTGPDGVITYNNIVNGNYLLKYILVGDMVGNFNREELVHTFLVDKDKTVYIPYLENNRIVGKVILNRDPLSSLGAIDISNIRIIAEDTKGHSYSALTDKRGNFILYAPVTDHYVVRINNIFYESFDLQQPEFIVKFNGYKQFEVSFIFNEKKRKINFNTDAENDTTAQENDDKQLILDDIKAIRKTTLSGKIRDVITLKPIGATVEIINNKTNQVVSREISNKITGNYNISYVADENYRIEVKSEGYVKYSENLYIEQVISIQNITKDIMITKQKKD